MEKREKGEDRGIGGRKEKDVKKERKGGGERGRVGGKEEAP